MCFFIPILAIIGVCFPDFIISKSKLYVEHRLLFSSKSKTTTRMTHMACLLPCIPEALRKVQIFRQQIAEQDINFRTRYLVHPYLRRSDNKLQARIYPNVLQKTNKLVISGCQYPCFSVLLFCFNINIYIKKGK